MNFITAILIMRQKLCKNCIPLMTSFQISLRGDSDVGDSDVGDIVMLVTFFVMLVIFSMY